MIGAVTVTGCSSVPGRAIVPGTLLVLAAIVAWTRRGRTLAPLLSRR